jgi:hypothetical protein
MFETEVAEKNETYLMINILFRIANELHGTHN